MQRAADERERRGERGAQGHDVDHSFIDLDRIRIVVEEEGIRGLIERGHSARRAIGAFHHRGGDDLTGQGICHRVSSSGPEGSVAPPTAASIAVNWVPTRSQLTSARTRTEALRPTTTAAR